MLKPFLLTALAAFLALSPLAKGHGVERGDVHKAISGIGMSVEAEDKVNAALKERCDLGGAAQIVAEIKTVGRELDQGKMDYYHTLRLMVIFPRTGQPAYITVKVAEYSISNPQVDQVEILSIDSPICR